jgi:hypothetical protein
LSGDCKRVLRVLDGILDKYNALSEEKRSVTKLWKKVQFGNGEMLDLAEIRLKIATTTSALTLFLNLLSIGSQGKVESYMESQGDALRQMRKSLNWITASMQAKAPKAGEGSILTTYAGDDKAIWKDFRRELIKEGFSSDVLSKHKETIKDYVLELGSRGALDDVKDDNEDEELLFHAADGTNGTEGLDRDDSVEDLGVLKGDSEVESRVDSEEQSVQVPKEGPEDDSEESSDSESFYQSEELEQEQEDESAAEEEDEPVDMKPRNSDERVELKDAENCTNNLERQLIDSPLIISDNRTDITSQGEEQSKDEEQVPKPANPFESTRSTQQDDISNTSLLKIVENHTETQVEATDIHALSSQNQEVSTTSHQVFPTPSPQHAQVSEDLDSLLPKWFGQFCQSRTTKSLWAELQFHSDNIVIDYYSSTSTGSAFQVRKYGLVDLCNWMLETAATHDQIQLSVGPLQDVAKLLSPLVDEFRCLLFRACAHQARVRHAWRRKLDSPIPDQWLAEFRNYSRQFGLLLDAFREFIRDGMTYIMTLKMARINMQCTRERDQTLWATMAESLYDMEMQDSIDFVYGLFEDEDIVRSRCDSVKRSPLTVLIPKVQSLLLFYKQYCEDYIHILDEEACKAKGNHAFHLEHSVQAHELLDRTVAEAANEMKKSDEALDSWSVDNVYSNNLASFEGLKPFVRSTASLNAILERCDEAQVRLRKAREDFCPDWPPPPVVSKWKGTGSQERQRHMRRGDNRNG